MSRQLNTVVFVHQDGVSKAYGPGDTVPANVAKLITNPEVWDGDEASGEDEESPETGDDSTADDEAGNEAPPRAGRGSGLDAWREYASETLQLTVPEDATREDIFALVDAQKEQ
jgi:hypothetical protein